MFIRSINWLYQHWQCELPVGSIWEEPWGGEGWPDYGWPYVGPHGSWLIITCAFFLCLIPMQVRGLFSPLQFAYAQFPCTDLSGEQMYDPFWEAVGRLEMCGFRVMALVSDGLSANRRLFRLHGTSDSSGTDFVYKVSNPYSEDRDLYFVSDPPHLIKTVRNAWSNKKRHLWVNNPFPLMLARPKSVLLNAVPWQTDLLGSSDEALPKQLVRDWLGIDPQAQVWASPSDKFLQDESRSGCTSIVHI